MKHKRSQRSVLTLLSQYRGIVMGFAALTIVYFHEWQYLFLWNDHLARAEDVFHRSIIFGPDLFFLMSGIGLTFAIRKYKLLPFWGKRLKRLAIPTLVAALCMALTWHWTLADYVKNVTGWNFYAHSIYSFLWFIPAILTLYLVFPLYWRFYSRAKNQLVFTLVALAVWAAISYGGTHLFRPDLYGFINRIPIFLTGVQLGWMTQQQKLPKEERRGTFALDGNKPLFWTVMVVFFVAGALLSYFTNQRGLQLGVPDSNCRIPNYLLSVSLTFFIVKLSDIIDQSKIGHAVVKFFGFYGAMSLEFYAIQEWLGGLILPHLQPHLPNVAINLVLFAIITAAGYALWALNHYFWKGTDTLTGRFSNKQTPKKGHLA